MKNIIILFTILISITTTFAQNEPIKSDLRLKVDSIIKYQLKPQTLDTAILRGQTSICFNKDSLRKSVPIIRSRASIPHTTIPLVILDRKIVELEELNNYQLKSISALNVLDKNEQVIYGSRGLNGVIVITSKKKIFQRRKQY